MRKFALTAFAGCAAAYGTNQYQPMALHAKSMWGAPSVVEYKRDLDKSNLKLWLSKKGVLSAVGHNLVLKVNDWDSKISMNSSGECELYVEVQTPSIEVDCHWVPNDKGKHDGLDGKKVELKPMENWAIKQIHGTMRGKDILQVDKFPTVVYKGKAVKKAGALNFEGTLSLKGKDNSLACNSVITVEADMMGAPYFVMKGETKLLQSNWGIKPLSQFMGSLQLKDEITARWEVHFVAKYD
uniref:Lipid/polyisoprenoid-binding YceI-like domain-containing protein n=1 Tax=Eutreptiella gymnastica TaxID=73025 RepID=A0A6U8P2S0_9EUGL|mmetsp:Transcript_96805/g.166913  ORF Transcript_96805/g.166913 Transcript_96805/m.166913 type:complete len:240 (+) Transcript_96805:69-788(+)